MSVINVGLLIGPLSVKCKDPGSLGKDRLFCWKKNFAHFAARFRHFPASAHTKSGSAQLGHFPGRFFAAPAYRSMCVSYVTTVSTA